MMPRLCDNRVGYFSVTFTDYTDDERSRARSAATSRAIASRRRIRATRAVSEPVKPIVYYIDPATPKKWMPVSSRASRDWQPAFEAAGFKNAIIAQGCAPNDPDWSPEDARYSVVRWLPSTTENASRPARARSAPRRDPERAHPVLPQRAEPAELVVLHAGRRARSARAQVPAARLADGRAARVRASRTKSGTRSASSTT